MKAPWEWTIDDVQGLITNQISESLILEYKSCAALTKGTAAVSEICKDISSFANSDGGTIIYGVSEDANIPTTVDVGFDLGETQKEWLEQIINSRIRPRIPGIRINQIVLENGSARVIYVVYIPKSEQAPHMTNNRYYKRYNYQSIAMEDYEVRDVMNRRQSPLLTITIQIARSESFQHHHFKKETNDHIQTSGINLIIKNNSNTPANYAVIHIFLDRRLEVVSHPGFNIGAESTFVLSKKYIFVNAYQMNWAIPGKMPIWKDIEFGVNDKPIVFTYPKEEEAITYYLGWAANSPGMEVQRGMYTFEPNSKGFKWGPIRDEFEFQSFIWGDKEYINLEK
ncbi:MAG TPA: ATP-binding protein [bacterium]|nr:ATP-binding protein [bacterium]